MRGGQPSGEKPNLAKASLFLSPLRRIDKLVVVVAARSPVANIEVASIWRATFALAWSLAFFIAGNLVASQTAIIKTSSSIAPSVIGVVNNYCVSCHDVEVKKGGLDLESISREDMAQHLAEWERVIRKLRVRQMPPIGKERPTDETYDEVVTKLGASLDRAAAKNPNPGSTETFRRLN